LTGRQGWHLTAARREPALAVAVREDGAVEQRKAGKRNHNRHCRARPKRDEREPEEGEGVTAAGNGIGLGSGRSLTIADSSITSSTSADIASVRRHRLRNVVCQKSAQLLLPQNTPGPPWGVCSDD